MNIKKFVKPNLKEAMAEVTKNLGEDAVIISTRQVTEGIELIAVTAKDLNSIAAPAPKEAPPSQFTSTASMIVERAENPAPQGKVASEPQAPQESRARRTIADLEGDESYNKSSRITDKHDLPEGLRSMLGVGDSDPHSPPGERGAKPSSSEGSVSYEVLSKMMKEFQTLRGIINAQTDMLVWRDTVHKEPIKAESWELLRNSGFSPLFARKVVEKLPECKTMEEAIEWIKMVIKRNVPVIGRGEDMVSKGGVYALVGPTGVGKTTTTAKIAARCVMKHGKDSVGLVTTDSFRIGAQDQLRIFGKILGVPVYTAQTFEDLMTVRQTFSRKHLVIIDTVGMAQRDERMEGQANLLRQTEANRILLLNAASQPETLDDVARHYKVGGLAGCIISKLDEAIRVSGSIDTSIRHKLPIHYLATGQQVPQDLYDVSVDVLIKRALNSKASSAFDANDQERSWMGALSHKSVATR